MRNDELKIRKSIIPIDWNPNDPGGYNKWMQMIVQENLKNSTPALENEINKFKIPKPRFINQILIDSFQSTSESMNSVIDNANKIIKGGVK